MSGAPLGSLRQGEFFELDPRPRRPGRLPTTAAVGLVVERGTNKTKLWTPERSCARGICAG
jgi:hypothetical protein